MTTLSTVTACLLGFVFALALTRPDLPGKGLFRTISILPLFSPPFAVAFSSLLLFGRLGLITHTVFHLRVDILGWRGLWLSQTISFFPIATLAISRVLENIPPSIEFVARNLGADEVSVFRTVTAPLARPGVAAAMLLVALYVLADFGNPLVIGGDFPILATEAWYQIEGWADQRAAAMLASLLLLPAALLFLLERRWVGRRLYTTILGRGARGDPGRVSRHRLPPGFQRPTDPARGDHLDSHPGAVVLESPLCLQDHGRRISTNRPGAGGGRQQSRGHLAPRADRCVPAAPEAHGVGGVHRHVRQLCHQPQHYDVPCDCS